jgi:hypothetical protein
MTSLVDGQYGPALSQRTALRAKYTEIKSKENFLEFS